MVEGKSLFWNNIIRAAEAEPREANSLRGASGFPHPVVALGVDESRRRVVIVSGEGDARSAALAQGDIQAVMPSAKLIMVRPVAVNLGFASKILREVIGRVQLHQSDLDWIGQHPNEVREGLNTFSKTLTVGIKDIFIPFSAVPLNLIGLIKEVIQQLSFIETYPTQMAKAEEDTQAKAGFFVIDFGRLSILDPIEADRIMGVCSIPLYKLLEDEIERLKNHSCAEEAREILRRHDVLQYFFPAADHLALGLLDREPVSAKEIVDRLKRTPQLGHPFGPLEIVNQHVSLNEVIDALQERGLLVEGKANFEVTPEGRSVRAEVSFKPREGLISKLLQRFSFNVDLSLRDLFK
jgi:hypothetical protein